MLTSSPLRLDACAINFGMLGVEEEDAEPWRLRVHCSGRLGRSRSGHSSVAVGV
jgi:hypothetical protein